MNLFVKLLNFFKGSHRRTKPFKINDDIEFNKLSQTTNKPNDNHKTLTMAKKTVITRVMEVEANESIIEFPQNRSLLIEQLTSDPPPKAEIIKGLRNMDDVFNHFKPSVKMDFEGMQGESRKETLDFREMRDFELDGLMKNADFLKELGLLKESYAQIDKQLRTNKVLREALANPDSRAALIKSLQALLKELKDAQ